jgi:fatty-acyl-CoA synthase
MKLTTSYAHGASSTALIGETIGAYFDRAARRWGDQLALVVRQSHISWTYSDLKDRVDAFAAGLLELGLRPGDRVGIWSPNNAEWVIAQFATAKAGLILVNINPAYRRSELEYALNKAGCKTLISAGQFKSSNYIDILAELAPEIRSSEPGHLRSQRLPSLRSLIRIDAVETPGYLQFNDVLEVGRKQRPDLLASIEADLQFDEPINIQFTSGTTGSPKGATLTHHNILNNGFFVGEAIGLGPRDRICIPVPLYHCFGMVLGNLACVTHG